MRSIVGLWRWRKNPLRRGTDLMEAWVALVAALLLALAAPATGWVSGSRINSSLQHTVRLQREERHRTTVTVTGQPKEHHHNAFDAESAVDHDGGGRVLAAWTAADGTRRTGTLTAPGHRTAAGSTFTIWTDPRGKPVKSPMDGSWARLNAVTAGATTALMAAVLVELLRRLVVWRLVRRRYHLLDRAWAKAGPDWGRTGAGS
ncbi:Rv1733c family protein [Streptomyces liangshanensis]|uniref:Uncharacterized protein n=1 Tax=Streptomyces liangshanensis TaxID=2717324 RepID=A0A6G9H6Y1_9ACTN|nr:hypothetical protein [Streptomyces liangshanensis]QIQ06250.1 hypothetical protein HA039_31575 [Streptomyces liangshanensis]